MKSIGVLENTIQEYAWGSKTAIPGLLGLQTATDAPQAELWMGAHPKAPSSVYCDGRWRSLLEVIEENPEEALGKAASLRFSNKLPFLFKVLAAANPLSIQAHPNKDQARKGFTRENEQGIPLDAPHRNYRDDNHKPEIICALTQFWALNGFRSISEILALLDRIEIPSLAGSTNSLRKRPNQEELRSLFHHLMTLEREKQLLVVKEAIASAEEHRDLDSMRAWMIKLDEEYPGDIGVLSVVLLNLIRLEPGQAMYLPAGEPHAYLKGVGIELMANSDNVLRGGLTPKHIDVHELLNILNFTEGPVEVLTPEETSSGEAFYRTPTREFSLSVIKMTEVDSFTSERERSVEILICTEGKGEVTELGNTETTPLAQGTSIIVPAAAEQYRIEGSATLYKATVPL